VPFFVLERKYLFLPTALAESPTQFPRERRPNKAPKIGHGMELLIVEG